MSQAELEKEEIELKKQNEAETRVRKQLQSQMVKLNVDENVKEKGKSKMYPSLSGHKGPLLDSCPPLVDHTHICEKVKYWGGLDGKLFHELKDRDTV